MDESNIPMRYNIIRVLFHQEGGMTAQEIYKNFFNIYQGEIQCNINEIDKQLMSLTTVGILEVYEEAFVFKYRITEYGRKRADKNISKYL
ncbi:hypothetical protein [Treponema primitia]|uniref:hypothetical protein n=1 Tax=Treponema primitia TaxID=88058 RepID=UPI0002554ECB|nr:hypothetical protein [Treponema primitia]